MLVDRGHGEHRLALVQRLHRQTAFAQLAGDDAFAKIRALDDRGQIIGCQDCFDARHGQRFGRVLSSSAFRVEDSVGRGTSTLSL